MILSSAVKNVISGSEEIQKNSLASTNLFQGTGNPGEVP